jgi:hypothetical protein
LVQSNKAPDYFMTDQDTSIAALEAWLSLAHVKAMVDKAALALLRDFSQTPNRISMAMPLPQAPNLPGAAKSFRLFALRPDSGYPFERHSNSHQWVCSLRGQGTIEIKEKSGSVLFHHLSAGEPPSERWSSLPAGTWHRPRATGEAVWLVATFHSPADFMDEYENESQTVKEEGK